MWASITHNDFTTNTVSDPSKDRHGSGVSVVKGVGLSTGVNFVNEVRKDLHALNLSDNDDRRQVGLLLLTKCPDFLKKFEGPYGDPESQSQGQALKEIYASFLARVISKFVRSVQEDVEDRTPVDAPADPVPADHAASQSRASVIKDLRRRYLEDSVPTGLFRHLDALTKEPAKNWITLQAPVGEEDGEEEHDDSVEDGVNEEMTS